jgi:hypothetical protein
MMPFPTSWLPKALRGEVPPGATGAVEVGVCVGLGAAVATMGSGVCNAGTAKATDVTATALEAAKMPRAVGIEN